MPARKSVKVKEIKLLNWKVTGVLLFAFIIFIPSLENNFVNWDDIGYVMSNDMITSFSWLNFKKIFSTYFMGNYHPFTMISLAIDYSFFRFSAPGYHFHCLMIHLINTLLVYIFFFKLLKKNVNIAVFVSLLFAIHPLHVESVAWVSERKDLLYAFYFFLGLIAYLHYLDKQTWLLYTVTLLLFIFALLSKAQAVTFPLVLILIDYFYFRRFTWRIILEKVPFFIFSIFFGIVAIFAQRDSNYINPLNIPFWQSIMYAQYSLWIYLWKFFFPVNMTSLYEYPFSDFGALPLNIYFSPVVVLILIYVLWKTWKEYPLIAFGLLFFLATIFPVLQFLPVGKAIVAERYTYIPYIGLSVAVVDMFFKLRIRWGQRIENVLGIAGIAIIVFYSVQTWNRSKVWKDSISLWTDVLEKNPESVTAYMNRAFLYNMEKQYEKAIEECTTCLEYDSTNSLVYKNRAIANNNIGNYENALSDYNRAILFDPNDNDLYLYRGIIYTDKLKQFDSGIVDFKKFLTHSPNNENVNFNLIVAYFNKQNYDSAKTYCLRVLKINPENSQARNLLARIDTLAHEKNPR